MIGHPHKEGLTQGTIFTCATSEDYPEVAVMGLVITARCDIEHGKAPIISYVPMVDLRSWLARDGLRLLAVRMLAELDGKLRTGLRELGLPESMAGLISEANLLQYIESIDEKSKQGSKNRYISAYNKKIHVLKYLTNSYDYDSAAAFLSESKSECMGILRDLVSSRIADFHYLSACMAEEECNGYVVLMREVRYVPAKLAIELNDGIDRQKFELLCASFPRYRDKLCIDSDSDFAMPIGLLRSPFIELFMQRFTGLFARIGVTDIASDLSDLLEKTLTLNAGGEA